MSGSHSKIPHKMTRPTQKDEGGKQQESQDELSGNLAVRWRLPYRHYQLERNGKVGHCDDQITKRDDACSPHTSRMGYNKYITTS